MLTLQACQHHPLVAMPPNKAKSFLAATVAKLVHRRRGKRRTRSKESRNAQRAHASRKKCTMEKSRRVGSAVPKWSEELRQEPG